MSTGYSSGMRKYRVTIVNRTEAQAGRFGLDSSGITWEDAATVWAAVDWVKGMRTLNAGAIDAYGVIMVRMNWNCAVNMRSRLRWNGQLYQILPETFHDEPQANTIQCNAQLVINEQI